MHPLNKCLGVGAALLAVLLCSSCSTPVKRMQKHPDIAAQLSDEDRQAILEGRIKIGFSEEMVYMAKGRPDRLFQRSTEDGELLQWVYEAIQTHTAEVIHMGSTRYRGQRVSMRPATVTTQQAYPHTTVLFEHGVVKEFTIQKHR